MRPVTACDRERSDAVEVAPARVHRACTTCRAAYRTEFARCPLDGGLIATCATDPLLGGTVAHYEIEALLGEGAMGRVYAARHARLVHRRVALKILYGELAASMETRLRFTQEAEATSGLGHPNVVSVVDFGRSDDGLLYLAMELVEGPSLSALIAEGPMAADRVIALGRQLAAGLAHAHARGFVHRDFKPDNVIVAQTDAGEVARIVDFGLAIVADPGTDQPRFTSVGLAVGTPIYAAPEQVQGAIVDARADLFSLGVSLFEMLAGQVPFEGSILEVMQRNALGEVPAIAARTPGVVVPPALEQLVRALMAPRPDARPAAAAAVEAALAAIPRASAPAASRRTRRRHWLAALAVAGAGILAVGAASTPRGPAGPVADTTGASPLQPSRETSRETPRETAAGTLVPLPTDAAPAVIREASRPEAGRAPQAARPAPDPRPARRPARQSPPVPRPLDVRRSVVADVPTAPALPASSPPSVEAPPKPAPAAADLPAPSPPPPPPPPTLSASKPVPLAPPMTTVIEQVRVSGSLTRSVIDRAVARALPALRGCQPRGPDARPLALVARFEIDEHRNPRAIQVADPGIAGLAACVRAALAGARTTTAPDIGTVTVDLVVRFGRGSP